MSITHKLKWRFYEIYQVTLNIRCMFIVCNVFLFAFVTEENPIPGMIGFYGFLAVFLLFFILGWVIKDNPKIPKDKDHQDSNDK